MSHFTNIKTNLQNLFYLERALNRLEIEHKKEKIEKGEMTRYEKEAITNVEKREM